MLKRLVSWWGHIFLLRQVTQTAYITLRCLPRGLLNAVWWPATCEKVWEKKVSKFVSGSKAHLRRRCSQRPKYCEALQVFSLRHRHRKRDKGQRVLPNINTGKPLILLYLYHTQRSKSHISLCTVLALTVRGFLLNFLSEPVGTSTHVRGSL